MADADGTLPDFEALLEGLAEGRLRLQIDNERFTVERYCWLFLEAYDMALERGLMVVAPAKHSGVRR